MTTKPAISINFEAKKAKKPNVFSNIFSTHKNAPKKYPTILKFEKRKNMTCPNIHADTIDQGEVAKGKYTGTKEPYRKSVLLVN